MGFAYDAEVLSLVLAARLQLVEQARTRCVMQADGISKGGHDIGHTCERCEIDEHDVIQVPRSASGARSCSIAGARTSPNRCDEYQVRL